MGGFGSGYQGIRKPLVEDCLTLSISGMLRLGALIPEKLNSGQWFWSSPGQDPHASMGYVADMRTVDGAALRLFYTAGQHPVDYAVNLTSTRPQFGGRRWWFVCAAVSADGYTGRRVAKLNLPPGEKYFASRQAHGLTYRTCRESGRFRALDAGISKSLRVDPALLRSAIEKL